MKKEIKPATIAKHMQNGVKTYGMQEVTRSYLSVYGKIGCAIGSIALSLHKGNYEKAADFAPVYENYADFGIKPELVRLLDDCHFANRRGRNIDGFTKMLKNSTTQDEAIEKFRILNNTSFTDSPRIDE